MLTETGLAPLPDGYYWKIANEGNYYPRYVMRLVHSRKHLWDKSEYGIWFNLLGVENFNAALIGDFEKGGTGNFEFTSNDGSKITVAKTYEDYLRAASEVLKAKWMARDMPVGMDRYVGNYPPKTLKEV